MQKLGLTRNAALANRHLRQTCGTCIKKPSLNVTALQSSVKYHSIQPRTNSLHSTALVTRIRRKSVVCKAKNPMGAIQKELGMQSTKIPADVRERVESAVEALGYRATIGDVAAKAGVKISEAEDALKALANDALGAIEVSEEGEVLYAFPPDFRSTIRNKSIVLKAEPVVKGIQSAGWYLLRIAFGSALVTSVVLVTLAIVAILSGRDNENDRRRGGYGYGGGGGLRMWLNVSDLFYYFDPFYYRSWRERRLRGEEMSFLEAVYSFVFGDGDPNAGLEEQRWKALGQYIQSRGGVVTAEEMAPYLDPPEPSRDMPSDGSVYEDEGFVLPALIRLGGEPIVDDDGQLVYRFTSLQTTAQSKGRMRPPPALVEEEEWKLTAASSGQLAGAVMLGVANVVGVVTLSSMLADSYNRVVLVRQGLGFLLGLMPYLQVYAAAFFGIPLLRSVYNGVKNAAINARNSAREQAALLLARPTRGLQQKMLGAQQMAKQKVVSRQDVVYTTEKEVDEQLAGSDLREFDRRLQRNEGKRWDRDEKVQLEAGDASKGRPWKEAVDWDEGAGGQKQPRRQESRWGDWS